MRLLPLLLIFLFACTSQKKVMDSWIGNNKQTLMMKWGIPARVEKTDQGEVIVYTSQRQAMLTNGTMIGAYDHKLFFGNCIR